MGGNKKVGASVSLETHTHTSDRQPPPGRADLGGHPGLPTVTLPVVPPPVAVGSGVGVNIEDDDDAREGARWEGTHKLPSMCDPILANIR